MVRVGIPRALDYFRNFPMWQAFFEEVGAEVVVSAPTGREKVLAGCSMVSGEVCLPVKVFCGHALSLKDRCDRIFIPSFCSLESNTYCCPKLIGLPDLIKAAVPDLPPLIEPEVNMSHGRLSRKMAYEMARRFTINPLRVERALRRGLDASRAYRAQGQFAGLKPARAGGKTGVALIGHPYLTHDDYINHRLVAHLNMLGVEVLFPEVVTEDALLTSLLEVSPRPYWSCEKEILGAGNYYLKNGIKGMVSITAFGCGPDSLMVELLKRRAQEFSMPFLNLVIDEHTAEAGLITRLEAFIDMTRRKKIYPSFYPVHRGGGAPERAVHTLGIPGFGNVAAALRSAAEKFGIKLVAPPITSRTLSLGTKYSPEFVCIPFKMILGSFIESLEAGADTLFMVTSVNACRMGYYARVQEKILRDLGYDFQMFQFGSSEKGLTGVLRGIRRLCNNAPWLTVVAAYRLGQAQMRAVDVLEQEVQRVRAVELKKGTVDAIFKEAVFDVGGAASISELREITGEYRKRLERVPRELNRVPLRVGIIGELYAVMEPFTNMNLEVQLGRLGVEVRRTRSAFFSEWARLGAFNVLSTEKKRLRKLTEPYMRHDVGGHGLESVGEKIRRAGEYDGFIHVAPFTCMPEVIAQNVMLTTREAVPVLAITCDEQMGRAGLETRLEAFVDLLSFRSRKQQRG